MAPSRACIYTCLIAVAAVRVCFCGAVTDEARPRAQWHGPGSAAVAVQGATVDRDNNLLHVAVQVEVRALSPLHRDPEAVLAQSEMHVAVNGTLCSPVRMVDAVEYDALTVSLRDECWRSHLSPQAPWIWQSGSTAWITVAIWDAGTGRYCGTSAPAEFDLVGASPPQTATLRRVKPRDAVDLSFVLPLVMDDIPRALILLRSLQAHMLPTAVELLVICPANQASVLQTVLGAVWTHSTVSLRVIPETMVLFGVQGQDRDVPPAWHGYALQMALKLLAAFVVRGQAYVTLDADVISLQRLQVAHFMDPDTGRLWYMHEDRSVHRPWWENSEALLGLTEFAEDWMYRLGFQVTPAVLSTPGAMHAVGAVRHRVGAVDRFLEHWIGSWTSSMWSEYTMYASLLEHRKLLGLLHTPIPSTLPTGGGDVQLDNAAVATIENPLQPVVPELSCENVWFERDWPWDAGHALASGCLFSVVQSNTHISPGRVWSAVLRSGMVA